jgi:hypothetical protein
MTFITTVLKYDLPPVITLTFDVILEMAPSYPQRA